MFAKGRQLNIGIRHFFKEQILVSRVIAKRFNFKMNYKLFSITKIALILGVVFLISTASRCNRPEEDTGYDIKASFLKCRDPFIYYHQPEQMYYLHVNGGGKLTYYVSKDLENWKFCGTSFSPDEDFWGKNDFWAPDLYEYKGKFYIFVTLSAPGTKRGTSVLVSDSPAGPFSPLVNKPVTPEGHQCLDGSLFIDTDGSPWLIYCREWLEVIDGQVCAMKLSDDLTHGVSEPVILFQASDAGWTGNITANGVTGKVTDAPFIYRKDDGKLVMLWSSFQSGTGRYAIGQAFSDGDITGPWIHDPEPVKVGGGHAMLFNNSFGQLMISYHSPNNAPSFLTLQKAYIYKGRVLID